MAKAKKSSSKCSILAICFIALVVFATLSLYVMVTRHATPEGESTNTHKDLAKKTVAPLALVEKEKVSPPIFAPQPDITTHVSERPAKQPTPVIIPAHTPVSGSHTPSEPQNEPQILSPFSPFNTSTGVATLHAVTYASHGGRDDRFCRAIESAVRHEVDLVILGWGKCPHGIVFCNATFVYCASNAALCCVVRADVIWRDAVVNMRC